MASGAATKTRALTIAEQASELRMGTFRLARRLRGEKSVDDLSDPQFSVLGGLYKEGSATLRALAERDRVSAPSMNRTVNCLEEAGYVTRETDAADRRKVTIALTEAGHTTVTETVRKRDAWITQQLRALTPDERDTLTRAAEIMRRLATQ